MSVFSSKPEISEMTCSYSNEKYCRKVQQWSSKYWMKVGTVERYSSVYDGSNCKEIDVVLYYI